VDEDLPRFDDRMDEEVEEEHWSPKQSACNTTMRSLQVQNEAFGQREMADANARTVGPLNLVGGAIAVASIPTFDFSLEDELADAIGYRNLRAIPPLMPWRQEMMAFMQRFQGQAPLTRGDVELLRWMMAHTAFHYLVFRDPFLATMYRDDRSADCNSFVIPREGCRCSSPVVHQQMIEQLQSVRPSQDCSAASLWLSPTHYNLPVSSDPFSAEGRRLFLAHCAVKVSGWLEDAVTPSPYLIYLKGLIDLAHGSLAACPRDAYVRLPADVREIFRKLRHGVYYADVVHGRQEMEAADPVLGLDMVMVLGQWMLTGRC
jgi:hypothetical protein